MSKNEQTLRERALSFSPQQIGGMTRKIADSLERREQFEIENGGVGNSGIYAKKGVLAADKAVAMFFLALGIDPKAVFERQLVEGKLFNAKSIKKVVEMAKFVTSKGEATRMEKVVQSFIACALLATDKLGEDAVFTNDVNRRFLNSADLTQIADEELREAMDDARHKGMTTGAATQSSQMRNVLDVLGLGEVMKVNRERDAVRIHADHPFFSHFRAEKMGAA